MSNDSVNTWGARRRYKGKMALPPRRPNAKRGSDAARVRPRSSTHGGHSPAWRGFERGQNQPYAKAIPPQFRVPAPTKEHHAKGIWRTFAGERIS